MTLEPIDQTRLAKVEVEEAVEVHKHSQFAEEHQHHLYVLVYSEDYLLMTR